METNMPNQKKHSAIEVKYYKRKGLVLIKIEGTITGNLLDIKPLYEIYEKIEKKDEFNKVLFDLSLTECLSREARSYVMELYLVVVHKRNGRIGYFPSPHKKIGPIFQNIELNGLLEAFDDKQNAIKSFHLK